MYFVALFALAVIAATTSAASYRRVCYHTNWSQYRPDGGKFYPEDIDASLCSNLVYGFATMTGNQLSAYEWNDDDQDWAVGMYTRFNNLKLKYPDLRTSLAVGGWNFGTEKMTVMLATPESRSEFITTSIAYLRTRNFDGLDLDFEYPANRGSPPEDRQRYTSLVQELRSAFDAEVVPQGKEKLLLSAAVGAGKDVIDTAYDVATIAQSLDWIGLMSYDFHGAWDPTTGFNAPLHGREGENGSDVYFNLEFAANYWVQKGCPASKLVLGMGVYGRCFQLTDTAQTGVGAPAKGPCTAGTWTREAGFLSYYEICQLAVKSGATKATNYEQQAPYVYVGDQWVGFDDTQSLETKVNWLMAGGFGGWLAWAIDLDDFSGAYCGAGKYPLLTHLNLVLTGSVPSKATGGVDTTTTTTPASTTTPVSTTTTIYTGSATAAPPTTTVPVAEYCKTKPDGLYADPESCTDYIQCAGGITHRMQCGVNTYFNPDAQYCDWSHNLSPERQAECGIVI